MISSSSLRPRASRLVFEAASTFSSSLRPKASIRQQRWAHNMPELAHGKDFDANGIGRMLSPEGFVKAWHQQQQYNLFRLNQLVEGTADSTATTYALAIRYARNPSYASHFNYASQAHNHHMFFSTLTNKQTTPSGPLLQEINRSFSSLDSLRATMIASAQGMFGPGFVWLVARQDDGFSNNSETGRLGILNTYLAGSPYPAAHWRAQGIDTNTAVPGQVGGTTAQVYAQEQSSQGSQAFGLHSGTTKGPSVQMPGSRSQNYLAPGGQDLHVLMCVSTWEHVWIHDHGIGGKRKFLEEWWNCIDWGHVDRRWSKTTYTGRGRDQEAENQGW